MRKVLLTAFLLLLAIVSVGASVVLFVDGSLARLTGWYHFRPGMSLFPPENVGRIQEVTWMRISDLHDTVECQKKEDGSWWIVAPFEDRMSPEALQAILDFTTQARLVDTLPINRTTRVSMREFGVDTSPHAITLKIPAGKGEHTTLARYTLGSTSPWLADAGDGEHLLPTTYLRTDFYGRDKRIHVVSGNILSIFKNGLQGLRDAHPLHVDPDRVVGLEIARQENNRRTDTKPLKLTRASAQSQWVILSPTISETDDEQVENLIASLSRMRAMRIEDADNVKLPEQPLLTLRVILDDGTSQQMTIYAPFSSPSDGQLLCYATASDRPVVFTLPAEPRMQRRGGYAKLVNEILSLPLLPVDIQTQIHNSLHWVYWHDLPLTLNSLRSKHFSNIGSKDIDKVLIRSRFSKYPLRLRLIPGDSEGQVSDVWMYSAEGNAFEEADPEVVTSFLNGMSSIPVAEFLHDLAPGESPRDMEYRYGLNDPDYLMLVQPRECAVRAVLFGEDLPLVRDRSARVFRMKRQRAVDKKSGSVQSVYWVGMEQNSQSVYRLSPKYMKLFSFSSENWRKRNLTIFPVSALRTLTLHYMKSPLVLHYDYIGEEWTGTLGEEDITPRINPHRTDYYVRHLQNIRVKQWLSKNDEDALKALQKPVFSVALELELTDYSDVEGIVMESNQNDDERPQRGLSNMDQVRDMLTEKTETDEAFRKIATGERKVEKRSITIEIAPSDPQDDKPFFYGRIREDGSLFILSFEDAQGLDGQLLD